MIKRTLGTSGLEVSTIGLGCIGLSHAYGLDVAEQDGVNLIRGRGPRRHVLRYRLGVASYG